MASHHQPSGEILPFGHPTGPRFVRAHRPVDLYQSLEQSRGEMLDRVADALSGDRFFFWFLGFSAGLALAAVFIAAWTA